MTTLHEIVTPVKDHVDSSQSGVEALISPNICPQLVQESNIIQCDGSDTKSELIDSDSVDSYESRDEVDSNPVRAILVPALEQGPAGAPLRLEVDVSGHVQPPSYVPLCAVSNPRSGWNKLNSRCTFLQQVGPDVLILSEH